MLMSAVEALEVGTKVSLLFTVPGDNPVDHRVDGVITRIAPNTDDPHGAWPFRVAVKFDTTLPGLSEALAEMENELSKPK